MTRYEQWEALSQIARHHGLTAYDHFHYTYFVGRRVFHDPLSASVALLSAFDRVGIKYPPILRERPEDL